jgi:3D-(3,5/4)-trihydroxycyclohexane-1,2-dione acylhydrolase (decyclizing)
MAHLTAAQMVVRYMVNEGIPYVLGIFGHGNLQLAEALKENDGQIRFIQVKNEQNGVHIATAYAKMTRRPLAVTSSIGPGTTNLVTGAAGARINRIPVLLLPGDAFARREGPILQEVEGNPVADEMASDCLKPVSKYWMRVYRPEQLCQELPRAFEAMLEPGNEGPATICLPQDLQAMAYDYDADILLKPRDKECERIAPDERALRRAINCIREAKRPLIIAGGGVVCSESWEELIGLAEQIIAPVVHTQAGNGTMLFDHPLNAFSIGPDGSLCGNTLAKKADLVIGVGTRYTDFATCSKTLFSREVSFININICSFDVGKERAIKLWGHAKVSLRMILDGLKGENLKEARKSYYEEIKKARKEWTEIVERVTHEESSPMTQARVIGVLNDLTDEKAVVVHAAGSLPGHLLRFWKTKDPTRKGYHAEYGYSCMGYEIPGGIGVKLADPSRNVYVMVGDGSFLMQPQEIATAVQEKIAITVLVIDNGGYQCIRALQKGCGFEEFGNEFRLRKGTELQGEYLPIDYAKIAEEMGAYSLKVETVDELAKALERARGMKDRPTVINVKVEPGRKFPPSYNGWWDLPRPEISNRPTMQKQLREYRRKSSMRVVR